MVIIFKLCNFLIKKLSIPVTYVLDLPIVNLVQRLSLLLLGLPQKYSNEHSNEIVDFCSHCNSVFFRQYQKRTYVWSSKWILPCTEKKNSWSFTNLTMLGKSLINLTTGSWSFFPICVTNFKKMLVWLI